MSSADSRRLLEGNWIKEFTRNVLDGNSLRVRQLVVNSLSTGKLLLPHPLTGANSHAIESRSLDRYNKLVHMVSEQGEKWAFFQSEKAFISGFTTESGFLQFEPRLSNLKINEVEKISKEMTWAEIMGDPGNWSLDMRHPSPKHFFYDLLWGALQIQGIVEDRIVLFTGDNLLLDLTRMGFSAAEVPKLLLFPITDPHIFTVYLKNQAEAERRITTIEEKVRFSLGIENVGAPNRPWKSFPLVVHLNFQKRRVANLRDCLRPTLEELMNHKGFRVIIEGPTGGIGAVETSSRDSLGEMAEMVELLLELGIPYSITAGLPIDKKIPQLMQARLAIVPSGTGAILTNRLMKIPTVLHRTKNFRSPADLERNSVSVLIYGESTEPHKDAHVQSYNLGPNDLLKAVQQITKEFTF